MDFRWWLLQLSAFTAGISAITAVKRIREVVLGDWHELGHVSMDLGIAGMVALLGWLVYLTPEVPVTWYGVAYGVALVAIFTGFVWVLLAGRKQ